MNSGIGILISAAPDMCYMSADAGIVMPSMIGTHSVGTQILFLMVTLLLFATLAPKRVALLPTAPSIMGTRSWWPMASGIVVQGKAELHPPLISQKLQMLHIQRLHHHLHLLSCHNTKIKSFAC